MQNPPYVPIDTPAGIRQICIADILRRRQFVNYLAPPVNSTGAAVGYPYVLSDTVQGTKFRILERASLQWRINQGAGTGQQTYAPQLITLPIGSLPTGSVIGNSGNMSDGDHWFIPDNKIAQSNPMVPRGMRIDNTKNMSQYQFASVLTPQETAFEFDGGRGYLWGPGETLFAWFGGSTLPSTVLVYLNLMYSEFDLLSENISPF